MSEDVKENIQYEVQNVEYRQLVHELQNRLSNEDESKLIQLWNEYCSIQQDYDSQIRLIDWDEMAELFGISNLIKYVINNQVSENDEYYSIDGNGHIKMFSSIVYSEESPMNLKEIAEKIIDKLEEKSNANSDFEYEDECKYLIYEAKVNGKIEKRIIEVTDNSPLSFMESKLTEIFGQKASENLIANDFLIDVFNEIKRNMDMKVTVESNTNTNSNSESSRKKMKP